MAKTISHLLLIAMLTFAIIPTAAISTTGVTSPSLSAFTVSLGPVGNHPVTPGPDLGITNWTHNIIENPGLEDWFSGSPYRWSLYRSAKRYCWFATDPPDNVSQGTYSAGMFTQSGSRTSASTQWYQPNVNGDARNLTFDFDWLCTQVDTPTDSYFQISVRFNDGRYTFYFLCGGTNVAASNSTNYGYFHVQEPTSQWNVFSRNITADYLSVPNFGGSLPGNFQVRGVWFYAFSAIGGNEVYAFFDDAYLINGTTTHIGGTTQDGNLESATENPWFNSGDTDHGYVEQSASAHTGASSCNITAASTGDDSDAYIYSAPNYRLTSQNQGNFGFWWHLDLDNVNYGDTAHVYFQFTNFTHTMYLYYYLGYGGSSPGSNTTQYGAIIVAGFNTTGSWQYCERNLWQDASTLWGSDDVIVERIFVRSFGRSLDMNIELLVDDMHLTSRAIADADYEDQRDIGTNILGWGIYRNSYFNVTDQAYSGSKAANCSVPMSDSLAIVQRLHYRPLNGTRETYLDVMWRIDTYSSGDLYFYLRLNDGRSLNYVFATDNWGAFVNNSNDAYFNITRTGTIGAWNQMHRDLVHDYEEAFGSLPDTSFIEISLYVITTSDPLEMLFDDFYLYDDPAPLLEDVTLTPTTPAYDQAVLVDVEVKEQDLDIITLIYRVNSGVFNFVTMTHHTGEIYRATIPGQSYNALVEYFFQANDTWGMQSTLQDDLAYFSYTVADLTGPDVSIDHPSSGTEVTGTVDIDVTATDAVSGMDRVEFTVGGSMVSSDSSAPYSYAWDSTTVADGSVTITATAYDNDGNTATDSITLTANNGGTIPPPPPIPGFPFEAIILGLAVSLGAIVVIRRRRLS